MDETYNLWVHLLNTENRGYGGVSRYYYGDGALHIVIENKTHYEIPCCNIIDIRIEVIYPTPDTEKEKDES